MSSRQETLSSSDSEDEREKVKKLREQAKSGKAKVVPTKGTKRKFDETKQENTDTAANGKISLGKMKFVDVRPFKNMVLIDIREHYNKDGEILPGKKGISLQPAQWEALKSQMDEIDERIRKYC